GVNTHPEFARRVCAQLSAMNGVDVHETAGHFQAQSTLDNCVEASGALNTLAVSLMKIANDLRWLGSGPRAGIGAITLPAVQPGLAICTALAPHIGYDAAADIAKDAARTGRTIREVARERTSLSEEELARILDPIAMTEPGNV